MRSFPAWVVTALALMAALPAQAGLGGRAASVAADGTHFRARVSVRAQLGYTDNLISTDGGTTIHEFTALDGTVFAVSWQGPKRPDLQQLFGSSYFNRFQADNAAAPGHIHMRRALASTHADFVVRTGGYSGAQWGYAILPALAPVTFSPQVLQ